MGSFIKAISYHLPETMFSNDHFFEIFPETLHHKNNLEKIGVKNRHIVTSEETASDLAIKSAIKLFEEHYINKTDIDFVLFCAQEFDYYTPTTACVIQNKLGIPTNSGALDFNLGCSGFVYGLSIAKGLIESIGCNNVLLLTSSTLSKTFHPKDKSSRFLFGDGAAATLISKSDKKQISDFVFGTDGNRADKIIIKDGGARNPISQDSYNEITDEYGNTSSNANFYMSGNSIFNFGLKTVPNLITETLQKNNTSFDSIDLFIFHQANLFLINTIAKKINIPEHKIFNFVENVGNTVSSSIPIVIYEALKSKKAKKNDTILICGFGTGLSWAATIIKL